jgi:hypothetical protein
MDIVLFDSPGEREPLRFKVEGSRFNVGSGALNFER